MRSARLVPSRSFGPSVPVMFAMLWIPSDPPRGRTSPVLEPAVPLLVPEREGTRGFPPCRPTERRAKSRPGCDGRRCLGSWGWRPTCGGWTGALAQSGTLRGYSKPPQPGRSRETLLRPTSSSAPVSYRRLRSGHPPGNGRRRRRGAGRERTAARLPSGRSPKGNLKSLGRFALTLADGRMITPVPPSSRKSAGPRALVGLASAPERRGSVAMMDYPAVSAKAQPSKQTSPASRG